MRKTSAPAVYLRTIAVAAGAGAGAAYVTLRVTERRARRGTIRHRDVAELVSQPRRQVAARRQATVGQVPIDVDTVVMESATRRRLMESHLRDQLDAEVESRVEDALVEGFAIGYRAHEADGRG